MLSKLSENPSLLELATAVPDEAAARRLFEDTRWSDGPRYPFCDVVKVQEVPDARPMPNRYRAYRR